MMEYTEIVTEARSLVARRAKDRNRLIELAREAIAQGVTQRQYAADIGVSFQTVSKWLLSDNARVADGDSDNSDTSYRDYRYETEPSSRPEAVAERREKAAKPDVLEKDFELWDKYTDAERQEQAAKLERAAIEAKQAELEELRNNPDLLTVKLDGFLVRSRAQLKEARKILGPVTLSGEHEALIRGSIAEIVDLLADLSPSDTLATTYRDLRYEIDPAYRPLPRTDWREKNSKQEKTSKQREKATKNLADAEYLSNLADAVVKLQRAGVLRPTVTAEVAEQTPPYLVKIDAALEFIRMPGMPMDEDIERLLGG